MPYKTEEFCMWNFCINFSRFVKPLYGSELEVWCSSEQLIPIKLRRLASQKKVVLIQPRTQMSPSFRVLRTLLLVKTLGLREHVLCVSPHQYGGDTGLFHLEFAKINHCINITLSSSLNTYQAPKIIMASKEKNKFNAYCEFKWTPTKHNNVLLQGHYSEVGIV